MILLWNKLNIYDKNYILFLPGLQENKIVTEKAKYLNQITQNTTVHINTNTQ